MVAPGVTQPPLAATQGKKVRSSMRVLLCWAEITLLATAAGCTNGE
jgi:hypothetical protein